MRCLVAGGLLLVAALAACRGHVDTAKNGDGTTPASSPTLPTGAFPTADASSATPDPVASADPVNAAPPPPELPGGGRTLFPGRRLIGYCGTPGAPALGQLMGNLANRTKSMRAFADKFPTDRKPLLVFELIVVVVQSWPGNDGKYRRRLDDSVVDEYLKAARDAEGLLLLNIQPGQSDFMSELKHYEKYLHEPDVGVALDPEWAVKAKQKPGVFYGNATGTQINEIADYLAGIVKADDLPEKALVFHQLNRYVVTDESVMTEHPGVVLIKSVDGLGPKHAKLITYADLMKTMAPVVHPGFKLFLDEDARIGGHVMGPKEVMALTPQPEYVMVE